MWSTSSSPAPSVHGGMVLPLQQLIVSGSKDGSVLVVDVQTGRVASAMDKVCCLLVAWGGFNTADLNA